MISYKGRVFQIFPDNGRLSYTRAKVMLQERRDRSVHVLYQDKELSIVKLPKYQNTWINLKRFISKIF
jgi:hypothetical protein